MPTHNQDQPAQHVPTAPGTATTAAAVRVGEGFTPFYPDARTWVAQHYTVLYVRRARNGQRWCAHWYAHPEALMRFEALWEVVPGLVELDVAVPRLSPASR